MEAAVTALFDEATNTVSYIVADPATAKPAIVDCVFHNSHILRLDAPLH